MKLPKGCFQKFDGLYYFNHKGDAGASSADGRRICKGPADGVSAWNLTADFACTSCYLYALTVRGRCYAKVGQAGGTEAIFEAGTYTSAMIREKGLVQSLVSFSSSDKVGGVFVADACPRGSYCPPGRVLWPQCVQRAPSAQWQAWSAQHSAQHAHLATTVPRKARPRAPVLR